MPPAAAGCLLMFGSENEAFVCDARGIGSQSLPNSAPPLLCPRLALVTLRWFLGQNKAGEVPMSSALQSRSARRWAIEEPTEELSWATEDSRGANNYRLPSERLPPGKRASRVLRRFLITFCIGVAVTLAWQSFGDAAREMIASSSPQLRTAATISESRLPVNGPATV